MHAALDALLAWRKWPMLGGSDERGGKVNGSENLLTASVDQPHIEFMGERLISCPLSPTVLRFAPVAPELESALLSGSTAPFARG